jgi:DNA recombination protein RmuC
MTSSLLLVALGALTGALAAIVLWLRDRQALVADLARLQAERDASRGAVEDQRALLVQTQLQVRETFAALSKDALADNRSEFLQHADTLLGPVIQTLDKVQSVLADVDKAREGTYRAVTTQLQSLAASQEQLRSATEGLSRSLRSPNVRGKWGEVQLRRIVELAGMLGHCDFFEQPSGLDDKGARYTPDLIVKLPGDSSIVIDAKVPIDAYLSACGSERTESEREDLLARHARQVRDHVRALGAKEYWRHFDPAPEFVVMFLPLEPLLSTAFEHDETLLEQAASLRVIPATPMTLLALLKAIAYGWQQQAVARNAEEIQGLGRELYERLATMIEHLEGVGKNIKQAADGYDRFVGSLEQKLLPSARRFKDLGVSSSKQIETPDQLNLTLRKVRKEELTGPAEATEGEVVQAESRFRS